MADDTPVIKSYIFHDGKCFYVSTINRDSSAFAGPRRFSETLVWEFDWEKNERGKIIFSDGDMEDCIVTHLEICKRLHKTGIPEIADEETR